MSAGRLLDSIDRLSSGRLFMPLLLFLLAVGRPSPFAPNINIIFRTATDVKSALVPLSFLRRPPSFFCFP